MDDRFQKIARRIRDEGGRALVVGGFVRDHILGQDSKDVDIEVYGLDLVSLRNVLEEFSSVAEVGQSFGVFRLKGLNADFSLPRRDNKTGTGHRGFEVQVDPHLDYTQAARRRDLTINSMAMDPLTDEILDPFDGRGDLTRKVLRATDARYFGEDPLRAVRVAQFVARLEMEPDEELATLCAAQDLSELSGERMFGELEKLLLKGRRPSAGFEFLRRTGLLRFFPEVQALVGVPQDPRWHPEGDVYVHTLMVIDEAAALRRGDRDDLALMFGALCHDFGKPATTRVETDRISSNAHDVVGVPLAEAFLKRLRASTRLTCQVAALVAHHLAPAQFHRGGAKPRAFRRLARKLNAADVGMELLLRVARADHMGRTTTDALAREFPAGEHFLQQVQAFDLSTPKHDVVRGRDLIARGFQPGPEFRDILTACRDIQDETGWTDPVHVLDEALRRRSGASDS